MIKRPWRFWKFSRRNSRRATSKESGIGTANLGDGCADIHHELEAAQLETDKLMKHLKVEPLAVPKKAAAK